MKQHRLLVLLGGCLLGGALWLGYWGWHLVMEPAVAEAQSLEAGHQEVAWIYPATSNDTWERLVAALRRLVRAWPTAHGELPELQASFADAFLQQTAAVPQIALYFKGHEDAKLWIRWYKLSGETDHRAWLDKLRKRAQPPLAVIGGDTSDRALALARGLQETRHLWPGTAPHFLITTATADRYYPGDLHTAEPLVQENWPKLMQVYKDRTFRFCFTNTRMAEAVLEFVRENPHIWPEYRCDPVTLATAAAQGNGLESLTILAGAGHLRPAFLYTLAWADDRYSQDLSDRFFKVFIDSFYQGQAAAAGNHYLNNYVQYSVGDFNQPNPSEQQAVGIYLNDSARFADQNVLLAVPTGTQRARRFLRTLCRRAPREMNNVIAVTGDAVTFNNVYRDREIAWNVLDMPVPLIFFSHRDPVDRSAGFGLPLPKSGRINTTATQDLLLLRDIIESLVQASWTGMGWQTDTAVLRDNLLQMRWHQGWIGDPRVQRAAASGPPLFDEEGNRQPRTGEHVVWLQPSRDRERILPRAAISVWSLDPRGPQWERVGAPMVVDYNQAGEEAASAHGRD